MTKSQVPGLGYVTSYFHSTLFHSIVVLLLVSLCIARQFIFLFLCLLLCNLGYCRCPLLSLEIKTKCVCNTLGALLFIFYFLLGTE
jgi:hypothetical protein